MKNLQNAARLVLKYRKQGTAVPGHVLAAARRVNDGGGNSSDQNTLLSYIGGTQTGATEFRKGARAAGNAIGAVSRYATQLNQVAAGGLYGAVAGYQAGAMALNDAQRMVSSQGFKSIAEGAIGPAGRWAANRAAGLTRIGGAALNVAASVGAGAAIGTTIASLLPGGPMSNREELRDLDDNEALQLLDHNTSWRARHNLVTRNQAARNRLLSPVLPDAFAGSKNKASGINRNKMGFEETRETLREAGYSSTAADVHFLRAQGRTRYFQHTFHQFAALAELADRAMGGTWMSAEGTTAESAKIVDTQQRFEAAGYEMLEHGRWADAREMINRGRAWKGGRGEREVTVADMQDWCRRLIGQREDQAGWALSNMPRHASSWE